jgi:rubrerythrin
LLVATEESMSQAELSLKQVLDLAVTTEEVGARYYADLAQRFANEKEIAEIFQRLGQDELAHAAAFRQLAAEASPDQKIGPDVDAYFVLRAATASEFFVKSGLHAPAGIESPADALTKALEFEKATLFYYQSVKEALGGTPELDRLIAAEKSHVMALMRVMVSDAKFRGLGDPW